MLLRIIAVGVCVSMLALSAAHAQTTGQAKQCVTFPPNFPPEAELRYLLSHPGVSVCPPSATSNDAEAAAARELQRRLDQDRSLLQRSLDRGYGSTPSLATQSPADNNNSTPVLPTRAFLPPHDLPPENFAAYGIVAFAEKAMSSTSARHRAVCEAFLASLPPSSLASVPAQQQMVTVWPVDSKTVPEQLKRANPDCDVAISHYDLPTALTALKEARTQQHSEFSGQGPYLLGWAPSSTKGQKDALVLVVDLSSARTSAEILERFKFWREQIEQKPELWRRGWDKPGVLALIRNWADRWGTMIFFFGPAKAKDE
jgi:hypothetical protein